MDLSLGFGISDSRARSIEEARRGGTPTAPHGGCHSRSVSVLLLKHALRRAHRICDYELTWGTRHEIYTSLAPARRHYPNRSEARKPNPNQVNVQFFACTYLCDRVAFLLPGVSALLRCSKPEVVQLSGNDVPTRLRRRRRELGLFQRDVAIGIGVTPETLCNWEKGRCRPPQRYRSAIEAFPSPGAADIPMGGAWPT